jgi:hypothetical protein
MSKDERSSVRPYVLAMVVADSIWRDPGSGKRTILGTFSDLVAAKFPATHPQLAVYVVLTDIHGKMSIRLRLIDAEENAPHIFEGTCEVECPDPRCLVEVDYLHSQPVFPHPGEYRLQLFANHEFLMERRICARKIEPLVLPRASSDP